MRNRIIQLLLLLCCLPIQTGCIGEDDYADDPVGNFEQLWKIIDERYCFLDSKGIDWDAVHEKYSKLIVPGMSNDDLFDKLSEMLYILKDGHVNLSSAKRVSYYDAWYQGVSVELSGGYSLPVLPGQCQQGLLYIGGDEVQNIRQ